ncbi:hypothetical protein GCAAIG_05200 [Candidatus Electronema halotolerans]
MHIHHGFLLCFNNLFTQVSKVTHSILLSLTVVRKYSHNHIHDDWLDSILHGSLQGQLAHHFVHHFWLKQHGRVSFFDLYLLPFE